MHLTKTFKQWDGSLVAYLATVPNQLICLSENEPTLPRQAIAGSDYSQPVITGFHTSGPTI